MIKTGYTDHWPGHPQRGMVSVTPKGTLRKQI